MGLVKLVSTMTSNYLQAGVQTFFETSCVSNILGHWAMSDIIFV